MYEISYMQGSEVMLCIKKAQSTDAQMYEPEAICLANFEVGSIKSAKYFMGN